MSDASTQTELVRKNNSVQMVGWKECPDPSGEKVSTCKSCVQVDGLLLHQVAELQKRVKRLHSIRGAKTEKGK